MTGEESSDDFATGEPGPDSLLQFWFQEAGSKRWFKQSDGFDEQCRERFGGTFAAARRGELWRWRETPEGRCAEIILLDQFSRNLYRRGPEAYSLDPMALALAQEAIACGDHLRMDKDQRYFTYMPFMHSESLRIHEQAIILFEGLGNADALRYEHAHLDVLRRFGRYPSRNAQLGRESTAEEAQYLKNRKGW